MKNLDVTLVSSLEKVLPAEKMDAPELTSLTLLHNEAGAFQLIFTCSDLAYDGDYYVTLETNSALDSCVQLFCVELSPCTYPSAPNTDNHYITKKPALIPDVLFPYHGEPRHLRHFYRQSFWVEITPSAAIAAGEYPFTLFLKERNGTVLWTKTIPVTVLAPVLPPQILRHTEWFHCDCLCQQYGCAMFSDAFFAIAENYVRFAVQHGINTLLTPVFTPSLDVEPGCRRMKAQLVRVFIENGQYRFDFSLLRRWIETFQACGIETFEISPFFTQWGSKYAVEIYAQENGAEKIIMGWNTPSDAVAYADFLAQFLPQLMEVLEECGVAKNTLFHISDEPSLEHIDAYRAARAMIAPYIKDCPVIDALSDYNFYKEGLVQYPVAANDHIQPFLRHKVSHLWTYYCCVQGNRVSNRFISMPSSRNRILGVQLYLYQIEGFLHWGYNFWNSQFSKEPLDPFRVTDAVQGFPSGDPFLVYPGKDGQPVSSIRMKIFRDALQDLRAMQLLETLSSRQTVVSLIENICGKITFKRYPRDAQTLLKLRGAINDAIQSYSKEE